LQMVRQGVQHLLEFLNITEDDVRRWDMEWIRYFRKIEAPSYWAVYGDGNAKIAEMIKENIINKSRDDVFQTKGLVSQKLQLWYDSSDLIDMKVAEIGCGVGRVSRDLARVVNHYVGFDYSELAIYVAKCTGPSNFDYVGLSNTNLVSQYKDSRDTVIFRNFFIHNPIENVGWILKLCNYLLKNGGCAVIDTYWPDEDHENRVSRNKVVNASLGKQEFPSMLYLFEPDDIIKLIEDNGFSIADNKISTKPPRKFYRIVKSSSICK
jgi:SAM-dependent methyltransferase